MIVLTLATPAFYSFTPAVKKRRELDARVDSLKATIEQQRLILQRHTREEGLLRRDPEYISLMARDRLDLMKEGETIFRFGTALGGGGSTITPVR
jgi:cell division protein FtsB